MKRFFCLLIFLSCFIFIDPIYAENVNDDDEIFKNFKGMDKPYNGSLPWESNERFKEALVKLNNPKLMAAYKAVLSDPGEGEGYNIGLAAQKLAGTVVEPGQTYSQNNTIGPYTEYFGYRKGPSYAGNQMTTSVGGGVCKVASVLYNVVTFSDLPVIMRYSHSMTVPYVPPGQDATVHYGVKDLRFVNNTEGLVLIWSEKVGDALYIALYGFKEPPKVTWHHKIVKKHDYWTTTRYNPQLEPGEEKVVTQGKEGLIVKSWVTIETADGDITIKDKGKSWYNASPRIVEKGVKRTFSDYFSTLTSLIPGSR